MEISLYFHIPFCLQKCAYCSFNSYPLNNFNNSIITDYFNSLIKEIELYSDILNKFKIKTVYFGGGTPSIVDLKYYEKIFQYLGKFNIENIEEITIEVNPATVDFYKLNILKSIGINRLSIGVQSFNNEILKFLKRPYLKELVFKILEETGKIFKNFSIDLIFAIPGQTITLLQKDLEYIKKFNIPHVSIYGLSVEKGSDFYKQGIKEAEDSIYAKMYEFISNYLNKSGYIHYEISNYAYNGFFSKHNYVYWDYYFYLGFGAGAHSFFENKRWSNISSVYKYIESINNNKKPVNFLEKLSMKTMRNEFLFLNLRKKEGVNLIEFQKRFNEDFLKKYYDKIKFYEKKGLLKVKDNKLKLTEKGFILSNEILAEFFI